MARRKKKPARPPRPKRPKGRKPKRPRPIRFKRPPLPTGPGHKPPHPGPRPLPVPPGVLPREAGRPVANTTCDIYYSPNAPDVAAVPCNLSAEFEEGSEASVGNQTFRWTHLLYVDAAVDVRDSYPSNPANKVYVPDKNNTGFSVVFVELVNRGTPAAYKRVFLNRQAPTWPTSQL